MCLIVKEAIEGFISIEKGYFILGASVIYCPNCNEKGYGDMLMALDMFERSDRNKGTLIFRSMDNGITWTRQEMLEKAYAYDFDGSIVTSGYGGLFTDEEAGVILFAGTENYWDKGESKSLWHKRKIYCRLSFDNGFSWTDKRYIIQKGIDEKSIPYDSCHYIKGVTFGINMAALVSPRIIKADDGSIIVGVQVQIAEDDRMIVNPTNWGYMKCGAIKGRWNQAKLDYEWELGEYVSVSLDISTRGVYEPNFEKIGSNKLFMLMRGSNLGKEAEIVASKFYSVSYDNGMTWSRPERLLYDDGSIMFSSSCIAKVLKHSNGKFYYIGVINDSNPRNNLPRYPLCIAEIDIDRLCIIKDTVTMIDTKRLWQDDSVKVRYPVDFSNHGVYEDRITSKIIVLAPFRPDLTHFGGVLNKYIIGV